MEKINLNYSFATVGTYLMAFKFLSSWFMKKDFLGDPSQTSTLKILTDFAQRFRETAQYSIYAQPGKNIFRPDDTALDYVDEIDSAVLGRTVYNINAFVSPWIGLFKAFFPYSEGLLGLPTRIAQAFDEVNSSLTDTFWDLRKIVWGLVPHHGRVSSQDLLEKQNQLRDLLVHVYKRFSHGFRDLVKVVSGSENQYSYSELVYEGENQKIKNILYDLSTTYLQKWRTLFTGEYEVNNPLSKVQKQVGEEEQDNHPLFVRSKIFSQLISLPLGFVGAGLNTVGACSSILGNFFDHQSLRSLHTKMFKLAHGLISLSYLTGEVPANINEFFKNLKYRSVVERKNLICAGIGFVAMLNKIKVLPVFSSVLKLLGIKGFMDKFEGAFDSLFYLFFSFNRMILHGSRREDLLSVASSTTKDKLAKFNNPWKFINLPIRVWMGDEDVTYRQALVNSPIAS